ncbi:class A beta-lactamase [Hydrocarboniphaga sp.]|uniref:class A beta-lactamase n=1 Tax=Hydrocarboniphaga sp. TaxID=2033016 RepID=UPI003D099124
MIDRRQFLIATGAASALVATRAQAHKHRPLGGASLMRAIADIENQSGGRLGVAVHDTATGHRFEYRADERFPLCSTFKFLLAAAVLQRVDRGQEKLERPLPVKAGDLVEYSPFTQTRVGKSASVAELCEAAMTLSDNAAANLLLPSIGGPAGLTAFASTIGDQVTRLDRNEPALNSALAEDPRDTSSPNAMIANLQKLLVDAELKAASRTQLQAWMLACRTGDKRLKAGLPSDWQVGDKTGSGSNGTTNDLAIAWPPKRAPLLIACYLTGSKLDSGGRDTIHLRVAKVIAIHIADKDVSDG